MSRAAGLLLALAALVLVACGGGGDSGDARTLARETFANPKKILSGDVDVDLRVQTKGAGQLDEQPISVDFTGPFARSGARGIPRFAFELQARLGDNRLAAGAISTGTAGFLSLGDDSYTLPAEAYAGFRRSFEQVAGAAGGGRRGRGSGELAWLTDPEVVGEEDVEGVPSQHVRGDVDVGRLIGDLTARGGAGTALSEEQRRQIEELVREPRFEFWTGTEDKLLRRVAISFRLEVPEGQRGQLGGLESAAIELDYRVARLNRPQTITAPENPQPVSALNERLREYAPIIQAVVSALQQGGQGQGSSPSPSPGVSGQAQRYARCLEQAANDVAAQQRCAELLR